MGAFAQAFAEALLEPVTPLSKDLDVPAYLLPISTATQIAPIIPFEQVTVRPCFKSTMQSHTKLTELHHKKCRKQEDKEQVAEDSQAATKTIINVPQEDILGQVIEAQLLPNSKQDFTKSRLSRHVYVEDADDEEPVPTPHPKSIKAKPYMLLLTLPPLMLATDKQARKISLRQNVHKPKARKLYMFRNASYRDNQEQYDADAEDDIQITKAKVNREGRYEDGEAGSEESGLDESLAKLTVNCDEVEHAGTSQTMLSLPDTQTPIAGTAESMTENGALVLYSRSNSTCSSDSYTASTAPTSPSSSLLNQPWTTEDTKDEIEMEDIRVRVMRENQILADENDRLLHERSHGLRLLEELHRDAQKKGDALKKAEQEAENCAGFSAAKMHE